MMVNDWVDVCIQNTLDVGELLSRLDDPTLQGAWEEEGLVHLYWAEDQWSEDRLTSVRSVISSLVPPRDAIALSVVRVPAQDWNETWTSSVKPLRIGRLVVRPSWEPVVLDHGEIEIILDPKQAFGTGHHATTGMVLKWLQENIRGGELVLDVGAGSAILGMAAVKFGAAKAIGVEIDAIAVDYAKEYVEQNGLADRIDLVCGTLTDVPQERTMSTNLVLANLDRQTILNLAEELAHYACSGARLILSGVLVEQEDEIVDGFSDLGLVCVERREAEGWVALTIMKLESCEGGA